MMTTRRLFAAGLFAMSLVGLIGCDREARGTDWAFTLRPDKEATLFETKRLTIRFEGATLDKPMEGTLRVAGPGTSGFTLGEGAMSTQYANGTATIQFGGNTIHIIEEGQAVRIGELVYQLEGDGVHIVIGADGTTRIVPG